MATPVHTLAFVRGALPWVQENPARADVGIGPYGKGCRGGRLCPPMSDREACPYRYAYTHTFII